MGTLKHSEVHRSGVTVNHWNWETDVCSVWATSQDVRFRFALDSKGGGRTDVLLTIGERDLPALLEEIVQSIPEATEWMAASIATAAAAQQENLRQLAAQAGLAVDAVVAAAARAHEAYLAAPSDDDDLATELDGLMVKAASAVQEVRDRLDVGVKRPNDA